MPPPSLSLPAVELAPMTNSSPFWSAATNINGRACRVLAANRTGAVRLPVWWPGMRPPSNTPALCAEVVFLDATTTPVRVSAFAALPGSVELHRIGGAGDGAWHTAIVPLPWDLVARVPGTDQMELSFASDAAAVPVAGVRVAQGNAAFTASVET